MSVSVAQQIGFGMSANRIPDPGGGGSIRVNDAGISVCVLTVASTVRVLTDAGYVGQMLLLANRSGSAISAITDSAAALALTLEDNETALCSYTGDSAAPWVAIVMKSGTVS